MSPPNSLVQRPKRFPARRSLMAVLMLVGSVMMACSEPARAPGPSTEATPKADAATSAPMTAIDAMAPGTTTPATIDVMPAPGASPPTVDAGVTPPTTPPPGPEVPDAGITTAETSSPGPEAGTPPITTPPVTPTAPTETVFEWTLPTPNSGVELIQKGRDGNFYFTMPRVQKLGRISPAGEIKEWSLPAGSTGPDGIAVRFDGTIVYTEFLKNRVGLLSPSGVFSYLPLPPAVLGPKRVMVGDTGDIWLAAYTSKHLVRMSFEGVVKQLSIVLANAGPVAIAQGVGYIYFTLPDSRQIGRLSTMGNGYAILPVNFGAPIDVAGSADGSAWYTTTAGRIGYLGTTTPTEVVVGGPTATPSALGQIVTGSSGQMWFANVSDRTLYNVAFNPAGHRATTQLMSPPFDLAEGANRTFWYTSPTTNRIGRVRY